jgi:O-antigen/teichoic acid export membrane protein
MFKILSAFSFGMIVNLIIQFISIPIFLKLWGVDMYSEWLILTSMISFFSFADIGLSEVASNEFTINYVNREYKKCNDLLVNTFIFITLIFLLLFFIQLFIFVFIDIKYFFRLKYFSESNFKFCFFILTIQIYFIMISNLLNSIYRSSNRYYYAILFDNITKLLQFIILIICIVVKLKLTTMIIFYTLPIIFNLLFKLVNSKKIFIYKLHFSSFNFIIIKSLLIPSLAFLAMPISNALLNHGFIFLIKFSLNNKFLIAFTTIRTFVFFIKSAQSVINSSFSPKFSINFALQKYCIIKNYHTLATTISLILSTVSIIMYLFFGKYVYTLWIGNTIEFNWVMFILFLISQFFSSIWSSSSVLLTSTNNHLIFSIYFLFSSIFAFLISYILIYYTKSITFLPLSYIIMDIVLIIFTLRNALKLSKCSLKNFFSSIFITILKLHKSPIFVFNKY